MNADKRAIRLVFAVYVGRKIAGKATDKEVTYLPDSDIHIITA